MVGKQCLLPAPADFGHDVIGPILHRYLVTLDAALRLEEASTAPLFVARAGVRIYQLLQHLNELRDVPMPQRSQVAWLSRLAVVKGCYRNRESGASKVLFGEFSRGTAEDVLRALWRHEPELLRLVPSDTTLAERPSGEFDDWLTRGGGAVRREVNAYFKHYEELLDAYIDELVGDASRVVLIDSGWQGTIHRILRKIKPDLDWHSILFGRITRPGVDCSHCSDVVGLMTEHDDYTPDHPESALVFHRHLVENLFEIESESIELLNRGADGRVYAPQAIIPSLEEMTNPLLQDAVAYLETHAGDPIAAVVSRGQRAMHHLHDAIIRPTEAMVAALTVPPRSADFGKTISVPVYRDAEKRFAGDTPPKRINAALWPQAQIVKEYSAAERESHFEELLDPDAGTRFFDAVRTATHVSELELPTVAVVTRTKNRPLLFERAAASVANQTYPALRWVVVNDGGDPLQVTKIIERSAVRKNLITLVSNSESVGMEAASNLGVRAVDTDFVVIHDDDDSWDPRFLEMTVDFLVANASHYGGVIAHSTYVSEEVLGNEINILRTMPYKNWVRHVKLTEMMAGNFFPPIAFVYRRDIYDKIGGYDETLPVLGDWEFNIRFLRTTDIGVVPEELAYYHHRDSGEAANYGNSVLRGRDLHAEFSTLLLNRMLRGDDEQTRTLVLAGNLLETLRGEVRGQGEAARLRRELAKAEKQIKQLKAANDAMRTKLDSIKRLLPAPVERYAKRLGRRLAGQ